MHTDGKNVLRIGIPMRNPFKGHPRLFAVQLFWAVLFLLELLICMLRLG